MSKYLHQDNSARFSKLAAVALLVTLILTALVSIASADGVYHSDHVEYHPVGAQPLRSGFVQNIHPNGPQMYAIERHTLNGAVPNTEYFIQALIYIPDTGCTDGLVPFPIDYSLSTNGVGNGTTLTTLPPEAAEGLAGLTINVRWQLLVGAPDGPVAYETECAVITLD
ncbi:MAG: hypothetical protein H6659_13685 [Ardenticatenaceae bacterium]|nr:hypothetical protein [Ardenticatenaceae bacterium]